MLVARVGGRTEAAVIQGQVNFTRRVEVPVAENKGSKVLWVAELLSEPNAEPNSEPLPVYTICLDERCAAVSSADGSATVGVMPVGLHNLSVTLSLIHI